MIDSPAPEQATSERPTAFWQLAAPVRGRVVLAGVLSGLGALAGLIPVLLAVELARTLVPAIGGEQTDAPRAFALVAGLVLAVVAAQALSVGGYTVSHLADTAFAESLRQRQITQSLKLRLDWFSRTGSSRVKKVIQDDVAKVHQLIAHVVPDTVNGAVRPAASLVLLFVLDWRLGLVALIPLVLTAASMPLMMKDMTSRFERYNHALAELGASIVEFVRGIAPIKVFEADGKGYRRYARSTAEHHRFYSEWMEATVYGSALMLMFTSPGFAIAVSAIGATLLVAFAGLDPVLLLPAVLLAANIAGPLFLLMQMRQFMREANGAAKQITAFFALPASEAPLVPQDADGTRVDLDDVVFSYDGTSNALNHISTRLNSGDVTALVGPSGSGKSTLAALLPRLLDADSGRVVLGGAEVTRISPESLYRTVAFVFQQPYLLRMSVRDNIRLARPHAGDHEVVAAARAAQIHDRIEQLPHGYDTIVGEQARLSGGEQQRLSIARAILVDAPLLVLDEATAFADPDSEAAIQRALAELTRGRTLLVIAHRLHTIADADHIVVLDGGVVAEQGTHEQLTAADGLYSGMWSAYQRARHLPETATNSREVTR